jgi:hypothetical protein
MKSVNSYPKENKHNTEEKTLHAKKNRVRTNLEMSVHRAVGVKREGELINRFFTIFSVYPQVFEDVTHRYLTHPDQIVIVKSVISYYVVKCI